MLEDVKLFGGFQGISRSGGGETQLSQRDVDLYETILSGNIGDPEDETDNATKIVTAQGDSIDIDARLNGLTISDCYSGFALWLKDGAAPLVIRCTFRDNNANASSGGAVRVNGSVPEPMDGPQFLACTFFNNIGNSHGAIYVTVPVHITLINCIAYDNHGYTCAFLWHTEGSNLTMINCTVTGSQTDNINQGAIKFGGVDCLISNCVIWGNSNESGQGEAAQLEMDALGESVVRNNNIQGLDEFLGNGNIDVNPGFVNAGSDDYRLAYTSLLLNNGNPSDLIADSFDIDDDSNSSEKTPARDMANRQVNTTSCVDIGAYENQVVSNCVPDISGSGDLPDGDVDIHDLLAVIAVWGTPGGMADMDPSPCGNSIVNITDLMRVIGAWGTCSSPIGLPSSLQDCEDRADQICEESEDPDCWITVYEACVQLLCEAEIIECE